MESKGESKKRAREENVAVDQPPAKKQEVSSEEADFGPAMPPPAAAAAPAASVAKKKKKGLELLSSFSNSLSNSLFCSIHCGAAGPPLPPPLSEAEQKMYLDRLPSAQAYEYSYMHRDIVTNLVVSKTEFMISGSRDGVLKFWKKTPKGMEFVKQYKAHLGTPFVFCFMRLTVLCIRVFRPNYWPQCEQRWTVVVLCQPRQDSESL